MTESDKSEMRSAERLLLSPVEKWRLYRKVPVKLVLHLVLLLLTLAQIQLYDAQNASYLRASHRNWAYFFLPSADEAGDELRYLRALYTVNDTFAAVEHISGAYFETPKTSVANYEHVLTDDFDIAPLHLSLTRFVSNTKQAQTTDYSINQDDFERGFLGPFHSDMPSIAKRKLVRATESIRFAFQLKDMQAGRFYSECFVWNIRLRMQVREGMRMEVEVDESEVRRCHRIPWWQSVQQDHFVWIHLASLLVASIYLVLSVRAVYRSFHMVARVRRFLEEEQVNSTDETDPESPLMSSPSERFPVISSALGRVEASFALQFRLFNKLQLLVCLSLVLLITSCIWSLSAAQAHVPLAFTHRLVHSSALLFLWSAVVGYLEHSNSLYSIVLTLKTSIPRVLQFLAGVSPIFVGFALFGSTYFGARVALFGSLSDSIITLFAVMNGDEILDVFQALDSGGFPVSGKAFMYLFMSLFMYVVLNIFIAIVEEAFFASRNSRRLLSLVLSKDDTHQKPEDVEIVRKLLRRMDE